MRGSVLVVEDDAALRDALCDTLSLSGIDARAASDGQAALAMLTDGEPELVVSDVQMSRVDGFKLLHEVKQRRPELPVLLMTAYGSVQEAVRAMREGAVDYLIKPFEAEVLVGKVSTYLHRDRAQSGGLVAVDPATRELASLARRVAQTDVTVLIGGESGTGKEVIARHIHHHSLRSDGAFIAINCAAIPENMLEAMLFGHEKGAFTGAYKACPGKFELAQGGTLLLDEVSEMPGALQAKLLRVLQEREVERLGGREPIRLDVRMLATSNRDLLREVEERAFREDLYYRLNVFPLHVPALRDRPGDVLPLASHLLAQAAHRHGRVVPRLDPRAQALLLGHRWPGNVRELDNVVQRALVLTSGETIGAHDLHFESAAGWAGGTRIDAAQVDADTLEAGLQEEAHRLILEALEASRGSRKLAAVRLGISPRTLRYRLAEMRVAGVAIPQ